MKSLKKVHEIRIRISLIVQVYLHKQENRIHFLVALNVPMQSTTNNVPEDTDAHT